MRNPTRRRPAVAVAAIVLTVVLIAAACSGGDDDTAVPGDESTGATTTTEPVLVGGSAGRSTIPGGSGGSADADASPAIDAPAPLSGEPAASIDVLYRPSLAVKIDNAPGARPQAGINQADLVFEELVEGGLTRLLAVFQSRLPDRVGPVRSARSTDVPLLHDLGRPLFAWTGANDAFAALIRQLAVVDVGFEAQPDLYEPLAGREAPSHLFADPVDLYVSAAGAGAAPAPLLSHQQVDASLVERRPVDGVAIDFGSTQVTFEWDASGGRWARTQNGSAHTDIDGVVVTPTNVVIQFVSYVDAGVTDSAGAPVPEAVLEGSGRAWFLTDGQITEGLWQDEGFEVPTRYSANSIIWGARPGSTWVVLAPEGSATVLE